MYSIHMCMHICGLMLLRFADKSSMSSVLCSLFLQSFHQVLHSAVIECHQMCLHVRGHHVFFIANSVVVCIFIKRWLT